MGLIKQTITTKYKCTHFHGTMVQFPGYNESS